MHPNKRIFNNAKVSDHFAIIPTGADAEDLSEPEQKIYDLVTRRFLAIFYPAAEYNVTTRITRVEKEAFKTEGKVLVVPGWLAVYGKESQSDEENPNLPPLAAERTGLGQRCRGQEPRPPSRRRASTKRRCSRPWKAPASWSRTRNCARRCPSAASVPRPRAPPPSRA